MRHKTNGTLQASSILMLSDCIMPQTEQQVYCQIGTCTVILVGSCGCVVNSVYRELYRFMD